jgi:hypothetical protein
MEQYLIDTNIISDYLTVSFPKSGALFMDLIIDAVPNFSIITQIELLCWQINANIEEKVKEFFSDSVVIDIKPEVIERCVKLRKGKKSKPRMPL